MANENKQTGVVRFFPDWPLFRKLASRTKIRFAYKYALPRKEVRSGEIDEDEKSRIVDKYSCKWEAETKRINALIDELFETIPFYRDGNADFPKTRQDMLFKYFAYGFMPNEYFAFRLDNKSTPQIRKFISGRLRMRYRCQMNNLLQAHLFNDKSQTYELFRDHYHREIIAIEKPEDYRKYQDFIQRHPVFVKKQVYLAQGQSVELIDIDKTGMTEEELFNDLIRVGKHVLEEKIVQTSELAAFNESSVNTVRAITFNTKHGMKVPYCMIRTGRPGAFVDNSGAGGVQAEIDFETGMVISDGFDEMGGKYPAHPASKLTFKGYKLPDWEQLQELVFECASKLPQVRFIGWDLAHTKDGWVIVEGNENCYIIALQQIRDSGMRDVFEELMSDMDLNA